MCIYVYVSMGICMFIINMYVCVLYIYISIYINIIQYDSNMYVYTQWITLLVIIYPALLLPRNPSKLMAKRRRDRREPQRLPLQHRQPRRHHLPSRPACEMRFSWDESLSEVWGKIGIYPRRFSGNINKPLATWNSPVNFMVPLVPIVVRKVGL